MLGSSFPENAAKTITCASRAIKECAPALGVVLGVGVRAIVRGTVRVALLCVVEGPKLEERRRMWKFLACVTGRRPPARRVLLSWLLLAAIAGCMDSPRSESSLPHKRAPLHVSGLFEVPGVDLELQIYDHAQARWVRFSKTRTRAENPVIDGSGRPYFRYASDVVLPQSPEFWSTLVSASRVEARVRVLYGERVLQAFGGDAESCARNAYARDKNEHGALEACASAQGYARVFVSACGGDGEACCPKSAGSAAVSCEGALSCEAGVCVPARYPSPIVAGYQVDLAVPTGYSLRDAWVVLDDTTGTTDTERPLVLASCTQPGVGRDSPHPNVERLVFDFAFWKPGVNRFFVRGEAVKGQAHRRVESAVAQLDYDVPRTFGMREPGLFQLPEAFARTMTECQGPACKDRDGDGLNDLWENMIMRQLRPRLMFDGGDDLWKHKADVVRVLTSVTPIVRNGQSYVLLASVITFSRDYGYLIGWDHPGDTEAFGMVFRVEGHGALRWVSSVAKGHPCVTCRPKFHVDTQEFGDDGTPILYVEQDKHGLWQNGRSCREKAAFSCRGDRSLRPDSVNVGDYSPEGTRALVDALDGIAAGGTFGELAGLFPGDAVWTPARARIPGRFCGGSAGCTKSHSSNMPGDVLASVAKLFEQQQF